MRILFVCTANQCRSPIAEALLRARLPRHGTISVTSAGLMHGGYPTPPEGQVRMKARGIDLSGHRSRRVDRSIIESSGLILGMARRHVRAIIAEDRDARSRCFTLKDFVSRGSTLAGYDHAGAGGRGELTEYRQIADVMSSFDRERGARTLLGRSADDDITDPMGRSDAVWDAVVAEIEESVSRLTVILDLLATDSAA